MATALAELVAKFVMAVVLLATLYILVEVLVREFSGMQLHMLLHIF